MKYLKVFTDFAGKMDLLGDAERGRLFTAMLEYASTGTEPELKGNEKFLWAAAKSDIDRQAESYTKRCVANRKNVTNRYESLRTVSKNYDSYQDKDKDKDKENNIIPLSPNGDCPPKGDRPPEKRFVKPTADEVRAYCAERGNHVDAQAFVDFYAAKGWKVGSAPMKDWRAAVRTWEKRDAERKQSATSRPNRQRDLCSSRAYSAAELDRMGHDLLGGD